MVKEHLSGYADRDFEVVDYQMYELPPTGLSFRGPARPVVPGEYIACLGAAQTLGCFCEHPYPALLEKELGMPVLNLGYGGAGPRFYNRHQPLIDVINQSKFAVVQVMSGRSEENSVYANGGLERQVRRRDGKVMSADNAWRAIAEMRYAWKHMPFAQNTFRHVCRKLALPRLKRLIHETRGNWVASYQELLRRIKVPKVLFWFSRRPPKYQEDYDDLAGFFGAFPQLVNQEMLDQVIPLTDGYVELVSEAGLPQPLVSRFDSSPVEIDLGDDRADFRGQIWRENNYYPSPEMHREASQALFCELSQHMLSMSVIK